MYISVFGVVAKAQPSQLRVERNRPGIFRTHSQGCGSATVFRKNTDDVFMANHPVSFSLESRYKVVQINMPIVFQPGELQLTNDGALIPDMQSTLRIILGMLFDPRAISLFISIFLPRIGKAGAEGIFAKFQAQVFVVGKIDGLKFKHGFSRNDQLS